MNTYLLNRFNTGQVTLPKAWRSRFATDKYLAKETSEGLLIKPIIDEPEVVKNNKEEGLMFPQGVDPDVLINALQEIDG